MKQELNPQKYVDQINEIEEQAQKATIELLKNNPNGRYIHRWDIPDEVDDDGFLTLKRVTTKLSTSTPLD